MKRTKRIIAILMTLTMILSMTIAMSATVFAAGEGSLTVKNSEEDVTYNFYKIFDLTGKDTSDPADNKYDAIAYKIDPDWTDFFNGAGASYIVGTNPGSLSPINVDGTTKYINITDDNRVDFTNAAMKYAIEKPLTADKTASGVASGDVTVNGLDLGYYLMIPVDMTDEKENPLTTGTVASLTPTIPNGDIYVKATKPGIEKTDDAISADVGQKVNYELKGKVPNTSGTTSFKYIISDSMSSGLSFNKDVVVKIGTSTIPAATVNTWITYSSNGFTIDIPVADYQADKGKDIVLNYSATVNEDAIETSNEKNTAQLKYGRNPNELQESVPISEEVYTAKVIINKYTGNDAKNGTKLANAQFALMNSEGKYYKYTAASGDNPAKVEWVAVEGAPTSPTANVTDAQAAALAAATNITTKTTDTDGAASFDGIKDGTYYLVEFVAPDGYNRLATPQAVPVEGNNVDDGTTSIENVANSTGEFDTAKDAKADVNNETGSVLPSTGGIGTIIFYVLGSILVIGCGIVLISKRRVNNK